MHKYLTRKLANCGPRKAVAASLSTPFGTFLLKKHETNIYPVIHVKTFLSVIAAVIILINAIEQNIGSRAVELASTST